jgi:hypothetical protein
LVCAGIYILYIFGYVKIRMFRLKSKENKTTRRWIALSLIMSCETVMASLKK